MNVLDAIRHEIDSAILADLPVKRIVVSEDGIEGSVAALAMVRPVKLRPDAPTPPAAELIVHPNDWAQISADWTDGPITSLWGVPVLDLSQGPIGPTNGQTGAKTPLTDSETGEQY